MSKRFSIHDWQAKQRFNLIEHTVTFSKKDMADLHKNGKLVKADDDGKDHTYIFKGDLKEQSFDAGLQAAGGFSDEEMDDITSRDPGSPFPGTDDVPLGYTKARDLKEKLRQDYRNMSDEDLDTFSVEMVEHFLDNLSAQVRAKTILTKRGI